MATTTTTVLENPAPFEDFVVTDAPEQTVIQDTQIQIPFVLSPPEPIFSNADAVAAWIRENRLQIDAALEKRIEELMK